jgi:hypothetical protein
LNTGYTFAFEGEIQESIQVMYLHA